MRAHRNARIMPRAVVPSRATWTNVFGHFGTRNDQRLLPYRRCAALIAVVLGSIIAIVTIAVSDRLWASGSVGIFVAVQTVLFVTGHLLPSACILGVAYFALVFHRWELTFSAAVIALTIATGIIGVDLASSHRRDE